MEKIFFCRENFFVYKYSAFFNEKRIYKLISKIDEFYGMGELYTVIDENLVKYFGSNFFENDNVLKIVSKKRRKKIKFKDVYEYKFYVFSRSELSILMLSIINSSSPRDLTLAMNAFFKYRPRCEQETYFIADFLKNVRFIDYIPNNCNLNNFDEDFFNSLPTFSQINAFNKELFNRPNKVLKKLT